MSQLPNHEANHRHIHEGFTGLGQPLVVLAEAALAVQPGEGPLHHPPTGQGHEPSLPLCLFDYRKLPAQHILHPLYKVSSISPVSPYQLQATITPPMWVASRLLYALKQPPKDHFASVAVLHRGRGHYYKHHQAERVHDQVPLATPYILACIIATLGATFSPSTVLTLWLSNTTALGCLWRPSFCRSASRRVVLSRSHTPLMRHNLK